MKHELKRVEKTTLSVGEIVLDAEVGEKRLYSSRQAEIAMSTGDFEYVREFKDFAREDLEGFSIPELKKIAEEREIDLAGITLKVRIIDAILNEPDEPAPDENEPDENSDTEGDKQ